MKKVLFLCTLFSVLVANAQLNSDIDIYKHLILSQNSGLKSGDLEEIKITSKTFNPKNGITSIYFNQYYKGLAVYNAVMGLHIDKNNKVKYINHSFFKNIQNQNLEKSTKLSYIEAASIAVFSKEKNEIITVYKNIFTLVEEKEEEIILKSEKLLFDEIKLSKCWVIKNKELINAWNVNWQSTDGQNWWNVRVDANSGIIIDENNWVTHCKINHENSKTNNTLKSNLLDIETATAAGEGKTGAKYYILPIPLESPSHGNMTLLSDPSDSLASPYGWHDVNGSNGHEYTITRGNNVYASDDKDNNNQSGYSPDGGSTLNFDFTFDKTKKHSDYLNAAITNLFCWNNFMHDVWYHYGFDDASGNFQQNNYGRGGLGNDYVNADAQDGSGTNNANFSTPPDGQNPRMQMYVWNVSSSSLLLRVTQPTSIAKQYSSVLASFGPKLTSTPITGNLVLVNDGTSTPTLGCQTLVNGSSISGQIALIDRGNCKFAEKVKFAQDKGAKAAIIINNVSGSPFTMGGDGITNPTIPSIMISKTDGDLIKSILTSQTVKVSLYDSIGSNGKQYDSDFDNGIISHEYGHGISNRLTGGAANSNCLSNQEQMGEGWSDFFSLVMTHKPADKGTDKRGIGTYVIDQTNDGDGIRDYPYSTSMTINPVTYDNIKTFSVPHGVGSVWCSMIWDMYWNFIDRYGYDSNIYNGKGGNNIAMQLVIDGMKLQPCNPGFADGRDAILEADKINNNGANQDIIWKAFARRGLGYSANQGSSNSRSDGTSAFDVPKFDLPDFNKIAVKEIKTGDTIVYNITFSNKNTNTIKNITFIDTLSNELKFIKAENCFNASINANVLSAKIDSLKKGETINCKIHTVANTSSYTVFDEITDFENGNNGWNDTTLSANIAEWTISSTKYNSGSKSIFVANLANQSDNAIVKDFSLNHENPHLIFYHYYNSESEWDGGVVEILDNGNWEDLGNLMIENGYNSSISNNPQSTLSTREAFTGNSNGFVRTIINLNQYKNKNVKIRFRFASDGAQGAEGWYIDDISLASKFKTIINTANIKSNTGSKTNSSALTLILNGNSGNSINKINKDFKIIPNPFDENININSEIENYNILLTDIAGRVVLKLNELKNNFSINTSTLAAGTYILKVITATGTQNFKLIKY